MDGETVSAILAIAFAFFVGRATRGPKVIEKMIGESELIDRLRTMLTGDIEALERRLLDGRCGWSEADDLRQARDISQRMLAKITPIGDAQP